MKVVWVLIRGRCSDELCGVLNVVPVKDHHKRCGAAWRLPIGGAHLAFVP
jgi:hypothetical protein